MKIELWINESEGGLEKIYKELLKSYDIDPKTHNRIILVNEDENFKIEEGYIEQDGSIYISSYSKKGISYSINIPFEEWFKECIRFKSDESLLRFIEDHEKEIVKIKEKWTKKYKN